MSTAILYIRVSTDEQAKRGYSLEYQEEILRYYCRDHNIQIKEIISEDFSAKTFRRPKWSNLMIRLMNHKNDRPDYLLFTLWNRFSRNVADAFLMIKQLNRWLIIPQAIEQPLDIAIPENKLVLATYLAMAEVENERKSLSIKASMYKAKMQGRWMAGAPLGYRNRVSELGQKYVAISEPEATYIREAFEEVSQNLLSIHQIYLNSREKGLKCSLSNFWHILKNRFYCGEIVVKTAFATTVVAGIHEKIVSLDLFSRVQDITRMRGRKSGSVNMKKEDNENFPFRGFLYCPKCGNRLTGSGSKGRQKRYFYYHCYKGCNFRVSKDIVHEQFLNQIRTLIPDGLYVDLYRSILEREYKNLSSLITVNQEHITRRLEELQDDISSARSLLLVKDIDANEYSAIKRDNNAKAKILKNKLMNSAVAFEHFRKRLQMMGSFLSTIDLLFQKVNITEKKLLINLLYENKISWEALCFIKYLRNSVKRIFNQIFKDEVIVALNIPNQFLITSTVYNDIIKIEQRKERPITDIQAQMVAEFLVNWVKFVIESFIISKQ